MTSREKKRRADVLLAERGLAASRAKAQELIAAGKVLLAGEVLTKPSLLLAPDQVLEVSGPLYPWVSRGGLKLAAAFERFPLRARERVCLDVGASTGGFTDVLLSEGATKVFAVDVGQDQLAQKLRQDPRVINMEGVNARYLSAEDFEAPIDLMVCDASFISLTKLLPGPLSAVRLGGQAVILVKPQFEVGRARLGKGGIVRDSALHREVCDHIADWIATQEGWGVRSLAESPVLGPDGNKEFLLFAEKG